MESPQDVFEDLVRIMVDHDMKFVRKLYLKAQMPE